MVVACKTPSIDKRPNGHFSSAPTRIFPVSLTAQKPVRGIAIFVKEGEDRRAKKDSPSKPLGDDGESIINVSGRRRSGRQENYRIQVFVITG